ncbi:MAG: hypothetical protein P8J50_06390 [Acidimicrobiales bacterium]|jgi:hypothetical protein|nr:hypothetical protein [Acidimicrobiales bacterium]
MRAWRIPAVLMAAALVASACGDDSSTGTAGDTTTTTTIATTSTIPAGPPVEPVQLCVDVAIPTTDEIGNLSGFANIDQRVTTASLTYTDQHPETFASRLIDRDHGGTFVFRFTDDPGPHEAALEALPAVADSDVVIDVVQADFSSRDLEALQDEAGQALFGRADILVTGMGPGNRYNRVTLGITRPTIEHLTAIAAEFPDRADMFCPEGAL